MKKEIIIDNKIMHLILGKTLDDWYCEYGENENKENLWDFDLEEFIYGAVEINEDIYYWFINGRIYETDESVK